MSVEAFREQRENLMKLLFQYDFYQHDQYDKETVYEQAVMDIYQDMIKELAVVDKLIEAALFDYSLSRLNSVDRAIIRVATYELLKGETPASIVINEAIELTKDYSDLDDEKQHKFTNKVLDTIAKNIK